MSHRRSTPTKGAGQKEVARGMGARARVAAVMAVVEREAVMVVAARVVPRVAEQVEPPTPSEWPRTQGPPAQHLPTGSPPELWIPLVGSKKHIW